jgi:hypothetical protein
MSDKLIKPLQLTATTSTAAIEAAALNVPVLVQKLAHMPLRNMADADAILSECAPAKAAGKLVKAIDDARKELVKPFADWQKDVKAYADGLAAPLVEQIEASKAGVLEFKKVIERQQAEARADQQAKLNRLRAMSDFITTIWQRQTDKVAAVGTLAELHEIQAKNVNFTLKCHKDWLDLEVEYLAEANAQFDAVKAYIASRIENWQDESEAPTPPPVVTTATTTQAQLAVMVEAEPEVVNKGLRTVYKAFVPDWRQVDAVGLVAVLIDNPVALAKLNELVTNYVKQPAQILGVEYKEEQKVTAR